MRIDQFENENIDSISKLYNIIIEIDGQNKLRDFAKEDNKLIAIINYFRWMKGKFDEEEFRYPRDAILYFLKRIMFSLELLANWFGEKEELDSKKFFDNMIVEFIQNPLKDSENFIKRLDELQSWIINRHDDTVVPATCSNTH